MRAFASSSYFFQSFAHSDSSASLPLPPPPTSPLPPPPPAPPPPHSVVSPSRAANSPPMSTFGDVGPRTTPPTCPPSSGEGQLIGSVTRAAVNAPPLTTTVAQPPAITPA